jgi:uncharacterized protein YceH (UPF0502 family)
MNSYFIKNGDDWETKNRDELEDALRKPLFDKLDDFCNKLKSFGIERPDKDFFRSNALGITVDFNEIVNDVNNGVDPDNVRSEPDIEELLLRIMLYGQTPKDKANDEEKWLMELEFDDLEMEQINDYLGIVVDPDLLRVTEVDEYITDLEDKGVIEELVNQLNNGRYCGKEVRETTQIRDITYEFLTKEKRKIREAKKVEVELPPELQEELDIALKWVESVPWPFKDPPSVVGLRIKDEDLEENDAEEDEADDESEKIPNSSYPKEAWAHYLILRDRKNMPVHIIKKHVEDILAIKICQGPDGGFTVQRYHLEKGKRKERNTVSFWLDIAKHPFRKEDQRTSPGVDRLDAQIAILQRRKDEIEDQIQELDELKARISILKGDVHDFTRELADCEKAVNEIDTIVSEIRASMETMLSEGSSMKEVLDKGSEAERKDKEKDPLEKKKSRLQSRIDEKELKVKELEGRLSELPKLEAELEQVNAQLAEVEGFVEKAFNAAKI